MGQTDFIHVQQDFLLTLKWSYDNPSASGTIMKIVTPIQLQENKP